MTPLELLSGPQSALDPGGPQASAIAVLSWIMIGGATVIFVMVMLCLGLALFAPPQRLRWLASRRMIIAGGIAFPIVTLSALLIYGLLVARTITAAPGEQPVRIAVTGEQFWWRVRYEGENRSFETANELHLPVGKPVRLTLSTADVIHSFWVPNLAGKLDMIPGQSNVLTLQAGRVGIYRGQCTEFCGGAHALMAFDVVAHPQAEFDLWLQRQERTAENPVLPVLRRGKDLFLASGCGSCHAIRGTAAAGKVGPDLTHIGSRRTIAAATFPNNKGTLAGWIVDSQHLKPANKMPSFNVFSGEELRALASYLESLK